MKGLHPPAEHRARGAPCVTLVLCKLSAEKQMTLTLAWALGLLISPGTGWECAAGTRGDPLQPPWTQSPVWWCRRVTDGSRSGHDDAPLWGPPAGMGPLCCFLAMISPRYGPTMLSTVLLMGHSQISLRKTHVTTNHSEKSVPAGPPTTPGKQITNTQIHTLVQQHGTRQQKFCTCASL